MTQGCRDSHHNSFANSSIGVGIDRDYDYDSRFADNDNGRDKLYLRINDTEGLNNQLGLEVRQSRTKGSGFQPRVEPRRARARSHCEVGVTLGEEPWGPRDAPAEIEAL